MKTSGGHKEATAAVLHTPSASPSLFYSLSPIQPHSLTQAPHKQKDSCHPYTCCFQRVCTFVHLYLSSMASRTAPLLSILIS